MWKAHCGHLRSFQIPVEGTARPLAKAKGTPPSGLATRFINQQKRTPWLTQMSWFNKLIYPKKVRNYSFKQKRFKLLNISRLTKRSVDSIGIIDQTTRPQLQEPFVTFITCFEARFIRVVVCTCAFEMSWKRRNCPNCTAQKQRQLDWNCFSTGKRVLLWSCFGLFETCEIPMWWSCWIKWW